jgi:hypothetical protein
MDIFNKVKNYFDDNKKIVLTSETITTDIKVDFSSKKFIIIDKSTIGLDENECLNHNVFALARKNMYVKKLVVELVNEGYFLVEHKNGFSTFEKFISADKFKHNLTNDNLKIFHDLFYTLQTPQIQSKNPKLLVVFSSVADFSLNASISRRNFFTNFKSIGKYIAPDTYILRISDIGGVVGSFYLNNNFNKEVETSVQLLLEHIINELDIIKENVLFYGASKGATASLYHGIIGGYNVVAVDPIVSDVYHEKTYNDPHFTQGTFPVTKQEKFIKILKEYEINSDINIIYSENSPIYNDINKVIKDNDVFEKINYINVVHPKIKDHPDVGPNTIDILTLIINNIFYKLGPISSKKIIIEEVH